LTFLLFSELFKIVDLLSLQTKVRICQNAFDLLLVLFCEIVVGCFLLLLEFFVGLFFNDSLFLADIVAMLLLFQAVASVQSLLQSAVKLLLLLTFLNLQHIVNIVEATLMLLQNTFFFLLVEGGRLLDLLDQLVVLGAHIPIIIDSELSSLLSVSNLLTLVEMFSHFILVLKHLVVGLPVKFFFTLRCIL
jgi:hypothetical protein